MGAFSNLCGTKPGTTKEFPHQNMGGALWREVFGRASTNKEDGFRDRRPPVPGGSWGRSTTTSDTSFKRLLEAMRSRAPGGWSDNRYEQSNHFKGMQYVAIHRTGEQLAQAEFQVFEKDDNHPDGKRPVRRHHPGYGLTRLLEKPNGDDSFGDMMYMTNLQMDLTGMSLTWMVPNKLGQPMELYPVPTMTAIPQPVVNPDYPHGYYRIQPVYPYGPFSSYPTPMSAVGAAIPAQWMLRIKYPHPFLRYDGFSPLTALNQHIDQLESMDRSRWYQMKRTINPSAVLNFDEMEGAEPLPQEEIDRIRTEFEANLQGTENVGQLFVATPGAHLDPWGNKPIEMDYPAGWDQVSSFILGGGFGITKQAAGMIEDSSYSVLFATLKQLYWLTLDPKCARISAKFTRFLAPYFGDDLIVEVRCKPINDHEINGQKIDKGLQCRCITKNEVRKLLEMPVTQEPWGDEIAGVDSSMQAQGGMGPAAPGTPAGVTGPDGMTGQSAQGVLAALTGEPTHAPDVEQEREEPFEEMHGRGQPDRMGLGSLGPRKFLSNGANKRMRAKSMYEKVMEVMTNGHS